MIKYAAAGVLYSVTYAAGFMMSSRSIYHTFKVFSFTMHYYISEKIKKDMISRLLNLNYEIILLLIFFCIDAWEGFLFSGQINYFL